MEKIKEKYGLLASISMVVGIVVGTGIFFKASEVLREVNGNFGLSILAWVIGGLIMLIMSYNFANIALKYHGMNSMADFARATVGHKYGFIVGIFAKYIYFPAMTATVAFVVGMYFTEACGWKDQSFPFSMPVFLSAFIFLTLLVVTHILAPIISGKIQVSTTVIKMIPLLLMGIVGIIMGLANHTLIDNVHTDLNITGGKGFFAAICVTSFANEGWICATNLGAEMKNGKRNLPIALITGTIIVIIIYLLYSIGLFGANTSENLMGNPSEAVRGAFANLFGNGVASLLIVVVLISAIGTLNGLSLANSRSSYALARNNDGLFQEEMCKLTKKSNSPLLSSAVGYVLACLWLIYYYVSQTNSMAGSVGFPFDSSELPIISAYLLYIPILVMFMVKAKDLNFFKRYIATSLGVIAALFMIAASIYRHGINTLYYLIFFIILIGVASLIEYFRLKKKKAC